MSDDYKQDLKVDFFNLHLGYRDQAANYMHWAEKWANVVQERDKRRRFLRINIRANPSKYDLAGNASVAAVNAAMDEDEEFINLTHAMNTFASAMKAFDHLRHALDGLVRLYLNGYFTGPHPSTAGVREKVRNERGERVHTAQREQLQKSKRRIGRKKHGDKQAPQQDTGKEAGPN